MMNRIKFKLVEVLKNTNVIVTISIGLLIFVIYNIVFFLNANFSVTCLPSSIASTEQIVNYLKDNNFNLWNIYFLDTSLSGNIAFLPVAPMNYNPLDYMFYITPIIFIITSIIIFVSQSVLITNQFKCGYALFEVSNSSRNKFFIGKFVQSLFIFFLTFVFFYLPSLVVFYIFGGADVGALGIVKESRVELIGHHELLLNTIWLFVLNSFVLMVVNYCLNIIFKNKNYALPISLLLMISFGALDGVVMNPYLIKPELRDLNIILRYINLGVSIVPIATFLATLKKDSILKKLLS